MACWPGQRRLLLTMRIGSLMSSEKLRDEAGRCQRPTDSCVDLTSNRIRLRVQLGLPMD